MLFSVAAAVSEQRVGVGHGLWRKCPTAHLQCALNRFHHVPTTFSIYFDVCGAAVELLCYCPAEFKRLDLLSDVLVCLQETRGPIGVHDVLTYPRRKKTFGAHQFYLNMTIKSARNGLGLPTGVLLRGDANGASNADRETERWRLDGQLAGRPVLFITNLIS